MNLLFTINGGYVKQFQTMLTNCIRKILKKNLLTFNTGTLLMNLVSIRKVVKRGAILDYIDYYNNKRIKPKTKGLSPV